VLDVVAANTRTNTGESTDIDAALTRVPKKRGKSAKQATQPSTKSDILKTPSNISTTQPIIPTRRSGLRSQKK